MLNDDFLVMNYEGIIIEESLLDKSVLKKCTILSRKSVPVNSRHQTPWLEIWTLDRVRILDEEAESLAKEISNALDYTHKNAWFADYKNEFFYYIIFKGKVFKIDISNYPQEYHTAKVYGIGLGIPEHQLDFDKNIN